MACKWEDFDEEDDLCRECAECYEETAEPLMEEVEALMAECADSCPEDMMGEDEGPMAMNDGRVLATNPAKNIRKLLNKIYH